MEDNTKQNLISIGGYRDDIKCREKEIPEEELTPEIEIRNLVKKLSPIAIGHDLIRIGGDGDGGYLVPDDLEGIRVCFSAGYGELMSFESMLYTQYNMRIFIVDRIYYKRETVFKELKKRMIRAIRRMGSPDTCYPEDCVFEDKLLGTQNNMETIRFDDWIKRNDNWYTRGDWILQMDIEDAEWSVLQDVSSETLKRFRILVVEFHWMQRVFEQFYFTQTKIVFEKILKDFVVAHIHPNNAAIIYCYKKNNYRDIEICETIEVTFIRKDRVLEDNRKLVFPHKLDRPNLVNAPDIILPQIYQR